MNRTIKCRVWNKSEKRMIYGDTEWMLCLDILTGKYITIDFNNDYQRQDNDNLVLLEYIGRRDKNDKEIYEGDLVQYIGLEGNEKGQVKEVLIPDCFDSESDGSIYISEHWEVIGNIYENGDLLK